jgi:hypothetical protein
MVRNSHETKYVRYLKGQMKQNETKMMLKFANVPSKSW